MKTTILTHQKLIAQNTVNGNPRHLLIVRHITPGFRQETWEEIHDLKYRDPFQVIETHYVTKKPEHLNEHVHIEPLRTIYITVKEYNELKTLDSFID